MLSIHPIPEKAGMVEAQIKDLCDPDHPTVAVWLPLGSYLPDKPLNGVVWLQVYYGEEHGFLLVQDGAPCQYAESYISKRLPIQNLLSNILFLGMPTKEDVLQKCLESGRLPISGAIYNKDGTLTKHFLAIPGTDDIVLETLKLMAGKEDTIYILNSEDTNKALLARLEIM